MSGLKYFSPIAGKRRRGRCSRHQMFVTPIVILDSLLDYFSAAIRAIRVTVYDRSRLVLGSVHFGTVGL